MNEITSIHDITSSQLAIVAQAVRLACLYDLMILSVFEM
jgi:hypothetical protein